MPPEPTPTTTTTTPTTTTTRTITTTTRTTTTALVRTAIAITVLSLLALSLGAGQASAHNPACHQVAGADGPHYDDSDRTGSETAYDSNPNLQSPENAESTHPDHANSIHNREGSCSVGNAPTAGGGH